MFINYLFISGINYVTESAGKELMLPQIKEIQEDSESLEKTQSAKQKLKNIQVKEILLQRFVASQELESGVADSQILLYMEAKPVPSKEPSKAKSLEKTQTVKQKLKNIQVKEILLRRFVASQEQESGVADPHILPIMEAKPVPSK